MCETSCKIQMEVCEVICAFLLQFYVQPYVKCNWKEYEVSRKFFHYSYETSCEMQVKMCVKGFDIISHDFKTQLHDTIFYMHVKYACKKW